MDVRRSWMTWQRRRFAAAGYAGAMGLLVFAPSMTPAIGATPGATGGGAVTAEYRTSGEDEDDQIQLAGWPFSGHHKRRVRQVCPPAPSMTPPTTTPTEPPTTQPPETQPETPQPMPDLASGLETASATQTLAPNMLGDILGFVYSGTPRTPTSSGVSGPGLSVGEAAEQRILRRYKVGDNTSPIPYTRVMYSFNYFKDAFDDVGDVTRHFGGAELAFFQQRASFEIRTSLNTFEGFTDLEDTTGFGDLRTTFKYLAIRGESFYASGGFAIGWPISDREAGVPADNYMISPFFGYLWAPRDSRSFLQGFQQMDIPTEETDQILLHTDIAVGRWLRKDDQSRFITGIATTAELHIYTPLGASPHGGLAGLVYRDVVNMTLGATAVVGSRLWISPGVGIPISTGKDYDIEVQLHVNYRF